MKPFALLLLLTAAAQQPAATTTADAADVADATTSTAAAGAVPTFEAWRFNPRERTSRGLAAWEKQQPALAVPALDSALRLRPDDPQAGFNAGTAHLAAGMPDAEPILERAAREAPPGLAGDGFYNLGNARLAQQNAAAALEAYKESLRRAPDHAGAKRNLELALRLLKQQQEQEQKQSGEPGDDPREPPSGKREDRPGSQGDAEPSGQEEPHPSEEPQPGASGTQQSSAAGDPQQRPLPQFQDQQDMTAEQAAQILQAVDNLERERRRDEAKQRARLKAVVEKDW